MTNRMTRLLRRVAVPLAAMLIATATTATTTPAMAYENAFYPTQSAGNRGVDVDAVQRLLRHHQQDVDVTGVFDQATVDAVKAFQTAQGLDPDGIVGPMTWETLTPPLQEGDSGPAVEALQSELNAKRQLTLAVDGQFTAAVTDAVREFQEHAGIAADGVVGAETWLNLLWHYDYPDMGVGLCDQDPDGNGDADWGTGAAIGQLEQAVRVFAETGRGEVPIGDAGFEHGGDIPGHASHQDGLDIDLWPIRTDDAQCTADRITWESPEYDREATRQLAQAIHDSAPGHVKLIFFNDPVLIEEGLTQEYPNHDNHLHVRYCEAVHPNSMYTCAGPAAAAPPPTPTVTDVLADGIGMPWGMDFLPNGSALVTDRDSALVRHLTPDGTVTEVGTVPDVVPDGEGGLLGLAVSPTYETDQLVYVYYTAAEDNRIARMTYDGTTLGEPEVIVSGIDKASIHNGGRIEFGPDGMLYAGTGDAANTDNSQDPESLNGKILRMTPDGAVPADNPTAGSLVYSMGHRNVQGLTWDPDGRLWASELGQNTWDELNLIQPGANYGWPVCEGTCGEGQYVDPKATWSPSEASPSGLAYAENALWMASLRGERMWGISIANGEVDGDPVDFFTGEYGRLRAIEPAPDGSLWVATNTDGQVLRVELSAA